MSKTIRIRVNSTARPTSSGNIRIRTTVSNGHSTRTTTKTIRAKQSFPPPKWQALGEFFHSPCFAIAQFK